MIESYEEAKDKYPQHFKALSDWYNIVGTPDYYEEWWLLLRLLLPLFTLAILIDITLGVERHLRVHDRLKKAMSICVIVSLNCAVAMHWHHRVRCTQHEPSADPKDWLASALHWGKYMINFQDSDGCNLFTVFGVLFWLYLIGKNPWEYCKSAFLFVRVIPKTIYEFLEQITISDATIKDMVDAHVPVILFAAALCWFFQTQFCMCALESVTNGIALLYDIGRAFLIYSGFAGLLKSLYCAGVWIIEALEKNNEYCKAEFPKWRTLVLYRTFFGSTTGATGATGATGTTTVKADKYNINAIPNFIATKKTTIKTFDFDEVWTLLGKPRRRTRTPDAIFLHFSTYCWVEGNKDPTWDDVKKVLKAHNLTDDKPSMNLYMQKELLHLGLLKSR